MWQALVKMVEKWSCGHNWEIIYRKDYDDQKAEGKWEEGRRAHTRLILKCTKCGKLHTIII